MSLGIQSMNGQLIYVFTILISVFHCLATAISLPSIVAHPTSKNMSLNDTASFNCSASNVVYIFWQVNDTSIDKLPLHDNYDFETIGNVSTSKLEIKVYLDSNANILNNSLIACIGYGLPEGNVWFAISSTPARLLIQGKLDAPTHVSSVYDNRMFVVSWLPPFTLKGVLVKYLIKIIEISASGTETTVNENVTEKETASIVHVDRSSCTLYIYTTCVSPMTKAGEGQPGCTKVTRKAGTLSSTPCTTPELLSSQGNTVMNEPSIVALMCVMALKAALSTFNE